MQNSFDCNYASSELDPDFSGNLLYPADATPKHLFRSVFQVRHIKKLPADVKSQRCRVNTMKNYLLPKVEQWWGDRKTVLSDLRATGYLDDIMKEEIAKAVAKFKESQSTTIQAAVSSGQDTVLAEVNQHIGGIAGKLLKGVKVSHSTYNQHRFLESFETQSEANTRQQLKGTHRRTVPKHLENPEVMKLVQQTVLQNGGGFSVQKAKQWSCLAKKISQLLTNNSQAAKSFSQNYGNQFMKELYVKTSRIFERQAEVLQKVQEFGGIEEVDMDNKWAEISTQMQLSESGTLIVEIVRVLFHFNC